MPRLLVGLLLLLTGLAGFLASFFLLQLHVFRMWIRYPIAILIAYCVFLLLLRFWVWACRRRWQPNFGDLPDVFSYSPEGFKTGSSSSASSTTSGGFGFDLDLDEGWLLVLAFIALAGGLIASLYVIYIAPALLAELLLDGVLMVGLYKRLKHIDQRHWMRAALRRTIIPALLVAICFTFAGYAMQQAIPEAHSIVEVWKSILG